MTGRIFVPPSNDKYLDYLSTSDKTTVNHYVLKQISISLTILLTIDKHALDSLIIIDASKAFPRLCKSKEALR